MLYSLKVSRTTIFMYFMVFESATKFHPKNLANYVHMYVAMRGDMRNILSMVNGSLSTKF